MFKKNIVACLILVMVVSGCARNRGPEHFYFGSYSEAEALYNKGEYEKAIEQYSAYRDENPDGNLAVIALYYIAKSHLALGNNDKAKELFQQIASNYPDLVWSKFSETQLEEL